MYEKKTEQFSLALSPTERRALRQLAELEAGRERGWQSALVRRLIVHEARRRGVLPEPEPWPEVEHAR